MANYNNLSTLSGLQVGDVVTYNTATTIDFKKYKVKVELYGVATTANGGYTTFTLDPKSLSNQYFYWTSDYGSSLMYDKNQAATSRTAYYRIGVAGDAGTAGTHYTPGKGGGSTGGNGGSSTRYAENAGGGTQTTGGIGGILGSSASATYSRAGSNGTFGSGGTGGQYGTNTSHYGGNGGNGWYGGGGGAETYLSGNFYDSYPGGGGSGFAIGQSTTTYPSGYMGNNNTDITNLVSAISNATLTQGGSTETAGKMVLTILEVPISFPKYYNGTAWVDTTWKRYNGSSWEDIEIKYYDGSTWQ